MIARCPQCQARFRLDPAKIGPQGARIRCSKCQTIFRVGGAGESGVAEGPATASGQAQPAKSNAPTPAASVPAASTPGSAASGARSTASGSVLPGSARTGSHPAQPEGPRVLVAEADGEAAKKIAQVLTQWGLRPDVLSDGAEALLAVYRTRPVAAILGGHLPGVAAPVACELIRRTSELAKVKLIRVAPLDEPAGAPEFEADRIVEPGELTSGIETALEGLNLGKRPAAPAASKPAAAAPPAAREKSSDPQIAAAERLARIIVSDIVLYNQEKFEAAAKTGNVVAALEAELTEASSLFKQRIPEEVRAKRDFLIEELERRAAR